MMGLLKHKTIHKIKYYGFITLCTFLRPPFIASFAIPCEDLLGVVYSEQTRQSATSDEDESLPLSPLWYSESDGE